MEMGKGELLLLNIDRKSYKWRKVIFSRVIEIICVQEMLTEQSIKF